jgi:hypothetical protein
MYRTEAGEELEAPVTQTFSYASQFTNLDSGSNRLQDMTSGYLWHRSRPDCYLVEAPFTGEFFTNAGQATGQYYLNYNRFGWADPTYGQGFWLYHNSSGEYDVNTYSDSEPQGDDSRAWVPWNHIMEHTYAHFSGSEIKEVHTFWPVGTTEDDVLSYLVDALNNEGSTNQGGSATIVWASNNAIKTFFLDYPVSPTDKYTAPQLGDIVDTRS